MRDFTYMYNGVWFAWYPVQTKRGDWAWLVKLDRYVQVEHVKGRRSKISYEYERIQ